MPKGLKGFQTDDPWSKPHQFCKHGHDTAICGRTKAGTCESCRRTNNLRSDFGIDLEAYNKMFQSQNGLCKICYTHQSQLKRRLNVDHCHTTGKIRSLLCDDCNKALGFAKDRPELLHKMANYLENCLGPDR